MGMILEKLPEGKVFKDPIHRYIQVEDKVIWDLINSKEFQRLRRIKQLGTASITFHGAEHSRFNHSLGVYELVRRMVDTLARKVQFDDEERLLALCAGLLHDLGHGPFSHSFEKVFHVDHEFFTQEILKGNTEVNQILQRVAKGFPEKVASVIAKEYPNSLVVNLISSQLDADRMDYLLRDAFYTGVSYGNFDLERLLRMLRPYMGQLAVKASGMHAVEDYIVCRYQMYRQVYFHPVNQSAEVLLTKIFHRVKMLYQNGFQFINKPTYFEPFFSKKVTVSDYLRLDEAVVIAYFQLWLAENDMILQDLCKRYLNRNLFKYIEIQEKIDEQSLQYQNIAELFRKANLDPEYYLVINSSSNLAYNEYIPGEEKQPIQLLFPDGTNAELSKKSALVAAISGKKSVYKYLYFPQDFILKITDMNLRKTIQNQLNNWK